MEWLGPTLKPYDLLPRDTGAAGTSAAKAVADATRPGAAKPDTATPSSDSDSMWHVSFDDVLDVVNPLQHLPVVGTVYRALTHDQIKTPEKIAGDTLYGGVMGLASSVADFAFEKATGHNFGDTVLAFFTGHYSDEKPTAVASADQSATQTAAATKPVSVPSVLPVQTATVNETALARSLTNSGIDSDMAQRALYAYRRTMGVSNQTSPSPF
ncbi:MAG TPA: hypothetical protein VHE09_13310 [Rhizomicrobium sp.]|jgi:hypothetical protein|nr:hypothetical protein [Rhizomicrobium sp.]